MRPAPVLVAIARGLQGVNLFIGRVVAWLTVALVLTTITVVVLRYGFGIGSIALQEATLYLHATVFTLAAAGALAVDGHVRVDVFSANFPPAVRRGVEVGGHLLLLLPFAAFLLWASWGYVAESWRLREGSADSGGLPYVWLLKTAIPVMAVQLVAQALASSVLLLLGDQDAPSGPSVPPEPVPDAVIERAGS